MKMVKSVYKKILDNVPTHMPETGGMLGGQDGTVTKVVFDDGKDDDFRRCHYTPNVTMLNSCLVEWSESGIEFYGLFHTHFYGVSSLSKGDEIYIKKILENKNVRVTRIATGIPMGTDIEYIDAMTLEFALEGRKDI